MINKHREENLSFKEIKMKSQGELLRLGSHACSYGCYSSFLKKVALLFKACFITRDEAFQRFLADPERASQANERERARVNQIPSNERERRRSFAFVRTRSLGPGPRRL